MQDCREGVEVRRTVDLLRRYMFLERTCVRALATWFLQTPRYETKIGIGYQLWSHAERATELRARLLEMRGGHSEANVEPALAGVGEMLVNAPDAASFLSGWAVLVRHLLTAYQKHLAIADASANAQEIRILRRLLVDIEQSNAWADANGTPEGDGWGKTFEAALVAAGGVDGASPRGAVSTVPVPAKLAWPARYVFDSRITPGQFRSYDSRLDLPFDQKRIAEMEIFFNEFYAAGLLATIISDAWTAKAPWEFYRDMAHHFWDEVRHAEFGMVRLRELGVEPSRVDLSLFEASQTMPFLHRLCYLTLGLEVFFMPRKRPRVERYGSVGDRRTQLFADVDWSDEGNHVQYGKRWVEFFLKDDARSVEELQSEVAVYLKAAGIDLPEGQLAPY